MKLLLVGDYHAEPRDLDDCRALANFILQKADEHQCCVVFMGDQYHTHAIIHAEVQRFWYDFYKNLTYGSISLVGNHDKPGTASSLASAMLAHEGDTLVVSSPSIKDGCLFLPYYHDVEEFVKVCKENQDAHTVFCHATFDGSKYENGFYAGDGIDPNLIPQKQIISGHIHTPQQYGKVWYVGAPRWRILTDANTTRAIWLIDINPQGDILSRECFDTSEVCRQILHFEDREDGTTLPPKYLNPQNDYHVDIHGSAGYIAERAAVYRPLGLRIRTFRTQEKRAAVTESDGVMMALGKWIDSYQSGRGTSNDTLRGMLKERTGVAV